MNFSKMNKKQLIDLNNKMSIDYLANVKPLIAKEEQRNPYYLLNGTDPHEFRTTVNSFNNDIDGFSSDTPDVGMDRKEIKRLTKHNLDIFNTPTNVVPATKEERVDMNWNVNSLRDAVRDNWHSMTDIKKRFSDPSYEAKMMIVEKAKYSKSMKWANKATGLLKQAVERNKQSIIRSKKMKLNEISGEAKSWSKDTKNKFFTRDKTAIQAVLEKKVINQKYEHNSYNTFNDYANSIARTPRVRKFDDRLHSAKSYSDLYKLGAVPSLKDVNKRAISLAVSHQDNAINERDNIINDLAGQYKEDITTPVNSIIKMSQKSAQRTGDKSVAIDPKHAYCTPNEILKHYQVPKSVVEDVKRRNSPALTGRGIISEYNKARQSNAIKPMPGLAKIIHKTGLDGLESIPLMKQYDFQHDLSNAKNNKDIYIHLASCMKKHTNLDNKGVRKLISDGVHEDEYQNFNRKLTGLYSNVTPNNEQKIMKMEQSHPKFTSRRDKAVNIKAHQYDNQQSAKHAQTINRNRNRNQSQGMER